MLSFLGNKVYTLKEIKDIVKAYLDQYWNNRYPIDPVAIATAAGISVYGRGNIESYPYSGRCVWRDDVAYIEYNLEEVLPRQRHVVAHELGHVALMHKNVTPDMGAFYDGKDILEKQANMFADELLVPGDVLIRILRNGTTSDARELSVIFGVSVKLMEARIAAVGNEVA